MTINHITTYDFPDTDYVWDGYDTRPVPKCTNRNMVVLMDKLNEIINTLNDSVILPKK